MAKGRTRRLSRYSNEFKITAIRLASLPGTLIQDVEKGRGLSDGTVLSLRKGSFGGGVRS